MGRGPTIKIIDCVFEGNGGGVRVGHGINVDLHNTQFLRNGIGLLIEGRASVAERLGLTDLPHDSWDAFLAFIKQGKQPEAAAEESGLSKFLSERNIAIGSFLTSLAALFR